MSSRPDRRTAAVSADMAAQFAAVAARRRHNGAALVHGWVVDAAVAVLEGRGDQLPRAGSTSPGPRPQRQSARWTQAPAEYTRCAQLITDAGSSLGVVVRARIAAYLDADGDLLAMR